MLRQGIRSLPPVTPSTVVRLKPAADTTRGEVRFWPLGDRSNAEHSGCMKFRQLRGVRRAILRSAARLFGLIGRDAIAARAGNSVASHPWPLGWGDRWRRGRLAGAGERREGVR
jgi:hypothetical protein